MASQQPSQPPALSLSQPPASSNRAIESNLQIEPSKLQRFPMGAPYRRHRPAQAGKPPSQPAVKYHQMFIKILIFHWKSAQMASQQPPGNSKPLIYPIVKVYKWLHSNLASHQP